MYSATRAAERPDQRATAGLEYQREGSTQMRLSSTQKSTAGRSDHLNRHSIPAFSASCRHPPLPARCHRLHSLSLTLSSEQKRCHGKCLYFQDITTFRHGDNSNPACVATNLKSPTGIDHVPESDSFRPTRILKRNRVFPWGLPQAMMLVDGNFRWYPRLTQPEMGASLPDFRVTVNAGSISRRTTEEP